MRGWNTVTDYRARQHMTRAQVAKDLGVSMSAVYQAEKTHGLTFYRSDKWFAKMIPRAAAIGMTRQEAADWLGIPYESLSARAIRLNVDFRRAPYVYKNYRPHAPRTFTAKDNPQFSFALGLE